MVTHLAEVCIYPISESLSPMLSPALSPTPVQNFIASEKGI